MFIGLRRGDLEKNCCLRLLILSFVVNVYSRLPSSALPGLDSDRRAVHSVAPVARIGSFSAFTKLAAVVGAAAATAYVISQKEASAIGIGARSSSEIPKEALEEIRKNFSKYASVKEGNVSYMTMNDFLAAIAEEQEIVSSKNKEKYTALFNLADQDGDGKIAFDEYFLFEVLMTGPDADYHIAFSLVDKDSDGLITMSDFNRLLRMGALVSRYPFDLSSDWSESFFGKDAQASLDFNEFTQLLKGFESEKLRQAYNHISHKTPNGKISAEQFEKILVNTLSHRNLNELPPYIRNNIQQIIGEEVSYAQIVAFYNIIHGLDRVREALVLASDDKRHPQVTQKEFLRMARRLPLAEFTPIESNLVFKIFDSNQDGTISLADFEKIVAPRVSKAPAKDTAAVPKSKSFSGHAVDALIHFGLGAIAGAIGAAAVYPIDLVKTRMQNQRYKSAEERLYKSSWDCFKKTVKAEGPRGLYRGLGPQLVGVAPEKAIKLTVNDLLRSLFGQPGGHIYLPLEILAGAAAGTSQVIFTNPIEIVKIRLQVQGENFRLHGIHPKSAITIVRELGLSGLYKGASACLLRDAPFSAIYFPVYAKVQAKQELTDPTTGKPSKAALFAAGFIAGVPAASLVTPADVIKTRLQVEARTGQQTYKNIPDAFKKILAEEGVRAFFKGAGARVFRSSPQFGVTLLSYETLQRTFVPDLENPAPPTNAPVHQLDYDRLFRGGVSRSLRRADQRWGLFGHYRPEVDEDELDDSSREKLILGVKAVSAPAEKAHALGTAKTIVAETPKTVKATGVDETEVTAESEVAPSGEAVLNSEQHKPDSTHHDKKH